MQFFFGCIHTFGPLRNLSLLKIITVDSPKQQLSPGLGKKTDKIKKGQHQHGLLKTFIKIMTSRWDSGKGDHDCLTVVKPNV